MPRARLIDRVDEVGQHAQLQRFERPPRDVERIERVGQRLAGPQREQRMALEKPHGLARRRLRRDHDLRIVDGSSSDSDARQRRQRQRRDGIDNAIEFERSGG